MWTCTACGILAPAGAGVPLHPCPAMSGLTTPMTPVGVAAKVETVLCEDYQQGLNRPTDSRGRLITAVNVTRDDGNDRVVLAPTLTMRGHD